MAKLKTLFEKVIYWRITVSAVRDHADERFRPGVVYRVRDDVVAGLEDIILTKEQV